jgi:hypothetical protein
MQYKRVNADRISSEHFMVVVIEIKNSTNPQIEL